MSERDEILKKVAIIAVVILTIICIGILGFLHKDDITNFVQKNILKNDSNKSNVIENTEPIRTGNAPPYIAYFDEEKNARVDINNQVFRKSMALYFDKGTAKIKEEKDNDFREYTSAEILKDGNYTIKVESEEGSAEVKFIIDTKEPVITGIISGFYEEAQTIVFEDVNDLGSATLQFNDTTIDLKQELERTGKNSWTVSEKGNYILKAEDKHGNAIIPITFVIM